MNRRSFTKQIGAAAAASAFMLHVEAQVIQQPSPATSSNAIHSPVPSGPPQQIGMLMYPGMTALDFVGPHAFLSGLMNVDVHLLWKNKEPVVAARSTLSFNPTTTLDECPRDLDVLFVPGGTPGTNALMRDDVVLDFLADRGAPRSLCHQRMHWIAGTGRCWIAPGLQGDLALEHARPAADLWGEPGRAARRRG